MITFETSSITGVSSILLNGGLSLNKFCFISFIQKKVYFSSAKLIGFFNFQFENDESEIINDIAVDIKMFLALCSSYEKLNLTMKNGKYTFFSKEDTFKILMDEHITASNFEIEEDDIDNTIELKDDLKFIQEASIFSSKIMKENSGVYIKDKIIFSTDRACFFQANLSKDYPELKLSVESIILLKLINNPVLYTFKNNNSNIKISNFDITVYLSQLENILVPNYSSPQFIEKYNHNTYVIFNKELLLEELKFFKAFVEGITNERILVKVISTTSVQLVISEFAEIVRILTVEASPELVGTEFYLMRNTTMDILHIMEDNDIMFKIDVKMPATDFIGKTNKEKHVAVALLK